MHRHRVDKLLHSIAISLREVIEKSPERCDCDKTALSIQACNGVLHDVLFRSESDGKGLVLVSKGQIGFFLRFATANGVKR